MNKDGSPQLEKTWPGGLTARSLFFLLGNETAFSRVFWFQSEPSSPAGRMDSPAVACAVGQLPVRQTSIPPVVVRWGD